MSLDEYVNKDICNKKRYVFKHLVATLICENGDLNGFTRMSFSREEFCNMMQLVKDGYVVKHDEITSKQYKLHGTKYNFKTTTWGLTQLGIDIAIKNMNKERVEL